MERRFFGAAHAQSREAPGVVRRPLLAVAVAVAGACWTCGAATGCGRDVPKESIDERIGGPADPAASASASGAPALVAATQPKSALPGQRTCRDGFLFDLGGAPADLGAFGALTPIAESPVTARVALTGTMGTVTGPLQADDVERVTCKMVGNLRSCFQTELKSKPTLKGTLGLEIDIALNGKVMETRRKGGTITGENLFGCISNAFIYAVYPMPKAKTTFTYSLLVKTHAHLSPRSVQVVDSGVAFSGAGKLPPELVKRIVRATAPRFRACYELGVDLDPTLKGNVTAKLVVDGTGAVEHVEQGPTTMPDKIVAACVLGVFRTLSFPEPAGGEVEVSIPLAFANVP